MNPAWTEDDAVFKVVNLVIARYGEPDFRSKAFHCYRDLPLAWRMPLMTNVLEGEIENGGLAQFLWNTFHHYKRVLQDASNGYTLIGAPDHSAAVGRCMTLCSRFDAYCQVAIETAMRDQATSLFLEWYDEAETKMSFPEENLFSSDSGILQLKGRWILANIEKYRSLME